MVGRTSLEPVLWSASSVAVAYYPSYFLGWVYMPHPPCLNGKRFLPWPFSISCFPSPPAPGVLEDSPPKRPGASTLVSLKPRAALGGSSLPFPWSATRISAALQLEGTVGNRRQHREKTGNKTGPGAISARASPEACWSACCEPWGFSHREGGRNPASRLGRCHTAKPWMDRL